MKSPSPRLLFIPWLAIFVLLVVTVKFVSGQTTSTSSTSTRHQGAPTTKTTIAATTSATPTQVELKIGILIPNPNDNGTDVETSQILLSNFNVAAMEMAKNDINSQQLIPGVYVNLTYAYTSLSDVDTANEIFNTSLLIQEKVVAIVGDISSSLTELSAIVTAKFGIPQCTFSSYSASLSDKTQYPTLFRTVPTTYNTVTAVGNYISVMGWTSLSILATDDLYGNTISKNMFGYAQANNLEVLTQNFISNNLWDDPTAVLSDLFQPWPRVICFFTLNLPRFIDVLVKVNGESFGLLERNHVWITYASNNDDLLDACARNKYCNPSYLNGVVVVKDLYNLTGVVPEYDEFLAAWQNIPNMNYMGKQTDDLTWFQPNAYSCVQVLARGFNKSLDEFPGGRINAIQALKNNTFSPAMTPTSFNTGYQGPIGLVNFTETGDLSMGASIFYFIYANETAPFATSIDMKYRNLSTPQIFYDGTTNIPSNKPDYPIHNIYTNTVNGIVIIVVASIGLFLCIGTLIIILIYRQHKVIKLGSVLISSLELLGLSISHISALLYLNQPNTAICVIRPVMTSIAAVLIIGGIILRNYRIYRIFNNVFAVRLDIRDPMLAKLLGVLVFIGIALVVLWVATSMPVPTTVDLMLPDASVFVSCTPSHPGAVATLFEVLLIIYIFGLMGYAMYLAFKTRNVSATWSEAKPIAYVSYNLFIVVLLYIPTMFLPSNQVIIITYLRVAALEFASISTLLILFGPKLNALFRPSAASQKLYNNTGVTRTYEHTYGTGLRIGDFNYQKGAADYLLSAHEGILPVKIERKQMRLFAEWRMRQVIVFPEISHFLLINKDTMASQSIHYLSASAVETHHPDEHIIKILVGSDLEYFIQLKDELSLENWLTILNRRNTNQPEIRCRTPNNNGNNNNNDNKLNDDTRSHTYNNGGDDDYLSTHSQNHEDISLTPTIPTDIIRSLSANPSPSSSLHSQSRFIKRGVAFPESPTSSTRTKTFDL